MMRAQEPDVLRDIADGYHLATTLGLVSPAAAHITDSAGAALAAVALLAGHRRPAVTLTASSCLSWLASSLIHHGSLL